MTFRYAPELITTARHILNSGDTASNNKRAISTAYYALFHAFAETSANVLVTNNSTTLSRAWYQVYRALNHGPAKKVCATLAKHNFPNNIINAGVSFNNLQALRHQADYDPEYQPTQQDAIDAVNNAEVAIQQIEEAQEKDLKAFAVMLLLEKRQG